MELTLSTLDEPSSAYTTIGMKAVYSPTASGSPATDAYAMAFGRTTAAAVNPATTSRRSDGGCVAAGGSVADGALIRRGARAASRRVPRRARCAARLHSRCPHGVPQNFSGTNRNGWSAAL